MAMSVMPGDGVAVPNMISVYAVWVARAMMGTLRFALPTGFHGASVVGFAGNHGLK